MRCPAVCGWAKRDWSRADRPACMGRFIEHLQSVRCQPPWQFALTGTNRPQLRRLCQKKKAISRVIAPIALKLAVLFLWRRQPCHIWKIRCPRGAEFLSLLCPCGALARFGIKLSALGQPTLPSERQQRGRRVCGLFCVFDDCRHPPSFTHATTPRDLCVEERYRGALRPGCAQFVKNLGTIAGDCGATRNAR